MNSRDAINRVSTKRKNLFDVKRLLVIPLRLERKTCCLEGSCSIQLSYGTVGFRPVGIARFELATSCSQSRRDNRTTLYPVFRLQKYTFFNISHQLQSDFMILTVSTLRKEFT